MTRTLLLAATLAALGGCSARYATGPNGLPQGQPDVTYYGPGAPIGGETLSGPTPPPPGLPPPANLTTP